MGSRGQRVWQEVTKTSACCFAPAGSWGLGSPHKVPESLLSRLLAGGPSCPEGRGVPFSRGTGRGWSQEASEGTCWAATGKMVLLPWPEGFVPRGGHSGLACSARTPRSLRFARFLRALPLCPSPPNGCATDVPEGATSTPRAPPAPGLRKRGRSGHGIWSATLRTADLSGRQPWAQAARFRWSLEHPPALGQSGGQGPGAGADSGRAGLLG